MSLEPLVPLVRRRSSSLLDPRMAKLRASTSATASTPQTRRSSLYNSVGSPKGSPTTSLSYISFCASKDIRYSTGDNRIAAIGWDEEEQKRLLSTKSASVRDAKAVLKEGVKLKNVTPRSKISVLRCVDPTLSQLLQKKSIQTISHLANTSLPQVQQLASESAIPADKLDKAVSDAHQLVDALKTLNPVLASSSSKRDEKTTKTPKKATKQSTFDKISNFFSLPFP